MLPCLGAPVLECALHHGHDEANDGASMKWTNLVSKRVWRQWPVFFEGSWSALSKVGTMAWISGLRMTDPMTFKAWAPDAWTLWWESPRTSISFGTMAGRHDDS